MNVNRTLSVQKPNILLLTVDTLRADFLSCYGYPYPSTPNIDRLAAKGIRFTQAITGGSWTQAAFPVLLTATYASMHGGCLGYLSPERPSPIETMSAHGYSTGGFSTNPHLSRASGYARGFHHFTDLVPGETDPRLRWIPGGQWLLRHPITHYSLRALGKQMRPARVYSSAAEVTDRVCHWLDGTNSPFFAWVHYMDPHWPYHIDEILNHPKDIAEIWHDLAHFHQWRAEKWKNGDAKRRTRYLNLYVQSIRYLDAQIGRLLSHLDKLGRTSNTIIVLVADHGEEFLEHGRWGHWEVNLFDEIIKVPLILGMPGLRQGRVVDRQVRTLDIMPTILDICNIPAPNGIYGASMIPLWTDNGGRYEAEEAISEMHRLSWHRIAIRTEEFKYIWDSKYPERSELYNLLADPEETRNVIEQYSLEVERFQASILRHVQRVARTNPASTLPQIEYDEAVIRRLRDLGYVD